MAAVRLSPKLLRTLQTRKLLPISASASPIGDGAMAIASPVKLKTCSKCGKEKQVTAFSKRARNRDGLHGKCMDCNAAYESAWRAANRDKKRAAAAAWRAANPEKQREQHAKYYSANRAKVKAAVAQWRSENKRKVRAYQATHRTENRENVRARQAAWKAANPESARTHCQNRRARKREAGGQLSKGLATKLFALQRGKCACGCKQPLGNDYHMDHVMPLVLGGTNTDDNIQLLRAICNLQKSAKHPAEFMQSRGFLL